MLTEETATRPAPQPDPGDPPTPAPQPGLPRPRQAPWPVQVLVRFLWRTSKLSLAIGLAAVVLAAALGWAGDKAFDRISAVKVGKEDVADLDALARLDAAQPSTVVAADGSVLGRFTPEELHVPLADDQIPDLVRRVVVASEDRDFYRHAGFDAKATARAVWANVRNREITQGGSTITQQIVKNLYVGADKTARRKIDELRVAVTIESRYSKAHILATYLNTVYFGEGTFGIEAASRSYFRKPASELDLSEAALLVGVIPAPSKYNPRASPEIAETRRLLVLDRVAEAGQAPPAEIEAARAKQPAVFPPVALIESHPFFLDYVRRYLLDVKGYDANAVYSGGLRIETTLDPRLQDLATKAVTARLPKPGDPQAAAVIIDPATGYVRALVGGRDWNTSQVNLALGALGGGSGRQVGSSFKPFVLAAAYEQGTSPIDTYLAPAEYTQAGFAKDPVRNYDRQDHGVLTVAEATWKSTNTVYAQLVEVVKPAKVGLLARRMGVASIPERGVGPSIALGAYEASPLEVTAAYGAFATEGLKVNPIPVVKVIDGAGKVLEDHSGDRSKERVLSVDAARLTTATLEGVLGGQGTGGRAAIDRPAAGKTGTADDYGNAWFVGYTPQVVAGVWVGFPQGNVPMHNIEGVANVTGGSIPALIWHDIMLAATAGQPVRGFPTPPDRVPKIAAGLPIPPPTTTTTLAPTTTLPGTPPTSSSSTTATTKRPPITTTSTTKPPSTTSTTRKRKP